MQKYCLSERIVKTKGYSFYSAEDTSTRMKVTIKKLNKETTWDQILKNKNISLMNNAKMKEIAPIKQIVREENNFYCVFDDLQKNLELVIREELQKEQIFRISRLIIQLITKLHQNNIVIKQLRPPAIFISENLINLKLAHIQAFKSKDLTKLDLSELQDLRYSPPQTVLTSKDVDQRSMIFAAGLIISELILGKPLLTANTKINYIYELCKLFPEQNFNQAGENQVSQSKVQRNEEERFENVIGQFNFSNEFIALLREMLKMDRGERIKMQELLQDFDLIVASQQTFLRQNQAKTVQAAQLIKPNINQAPVNQQILAVQIDFDFQKKPTLSTAPAIKPHCSPLPTQKNVDDDAVQPIIIKQSAKKTQINGNSMPVPLARQGFKISRTTKQTISTTKRPQLTNYALNQGNNLGVKLGFQPTLFSQNQNQL